MKSPLTLPVRHAPHRECWSRQRPTAGSRLRAWRAGSGAACWDRISSTSTYIYNYIYTYMHYHTHIYIYMYIYIQWYYILYYTIILYIYVYINNSGIQLAVVDPVDVSIMPEIKVYFWHISATRRSLHSARPSSKGLKVNPQENMGKSVQTGVKMGSSYEVGFERKTYLGLSQEKVHRLPVDHKFPYLRQDDLFGASPFSDKPIVTIVENTNRFSLHLILQCFHQLKPNSW